MLSGGDEDGGARLLRVIEHAHGVAEAGCDMQIDNGKLARCLRVTVRHGHYRGFLQTEHVAQLVFRRQSIHQRQLRSAGIAEHDLDTLLLEHIEECAFS